MITPNTWEALIQRSMTTVRLITGSPDLADRAELRRLLRLSVRAERKLKAAKLRRKSALREISSAIVGTLSVK